MKFEPNAIRYTVSIGLPDSMAFARLRHEFARVIGDGTAAESDGFWRGKVERAAHFTVVVDQSDPTTARFAALRILLFATWAAGELGQEAVAITEEPVRFRLVDRWGQEVAP